MKLASGEALDSCLIVDDDASARKSHAWVVEDLGMRPLEADGNPTLPSSEIYASIVPSIAESLLCDHHLRKHNYANFNGAELVAALYGTIPALLCTRYEEAELVDEIRPLRPFIPVLLKDPTLENVTLGLEVSMAELRQGPAADRRPHRTQAVIHDVADKHVLIQLPGWTSLHLFRYPLSAIPLEFRGMSAGQRLHVEVNLGAEDPSDIYMQAWSL